MKRFVLLWTVVLAVVGMNATPSSAAHPDASVAPVALAPPPASIASSSADRRQLQLEEQTNGRWQIAWDPWTQQARWGIGGGRPQGASLAQSTIVGRADAFLQNNATLFGIESSPGSPAHVSRSRRAWHVTYQQRFAGRRIVGAFMTLTLRDDGETVAFKSRWLPPTATGTASVVPAPDISRALQACEAHLGQVVRLESDESVWAVLPIHRTYELIAARSLVFANAHGGRWQALVGANGVLSLESLLRFEVLRGTASGEVKPLYAQDADVVLPYAWLQVSVDDRNNTTTFTNAVGQWSLNVPTSTAVILSPLEGLYAQVSNAAGDPPALFDAVTAVPGTLAVHFGPLQARSDERTLYYHTNLFHDWVATALDFHLMDFPLPVTAAVRNPNNGSPDYANAFWDGSGMSFGNGGGRFPNFGLFADVIYHEYTHGITDFMYRPAGGLPGALGGALHEGLSDYFACTVTDEPLVGEQLAELGGAFRNLDNNLLWPDDRDSGDEVHRNGEIIAGALWDVRLLVGRAVADPIIHFARQLHPLDFEEYMQAILVQDDLIFGDGAQANGTPHDDLILSAFAKHGMGPLSSREVEILHLQLGDSEEVAQPRTVTARINSQLPGLVDEMYVHWSTGGASTRTLMQATPQGNWEATIPGQPEGTRVDYWLEAVKLRPRLVKRLPVGAPAEMFSYAVGPDALAPIVQHAPPTQLPSFAWPATLGMSIEDNVGIEAAWVEYRRNGGAVSSMGLVRHPEDPRQFRGQFPNVGGLDGDVFEYWIVAQDASQFKHVTRMPATGSFSFSMVETLVDGFEQEVGVWLHRPAVAGRDDPWHVSNRGNHTSGGQRAWLCGSPQGDYPITAAALLATDWYLLGAGATAQVWSWMDAEPNGPISAFDGGTIQILVDGELLPTLLTPQGGYTRTMGETADTNVLAPGTPCLSGTDSDWQLLEFDLAAYAGKRVQILFVFGSDNVPSLHSGWLLDDFSLSPGVRNPTDASPQQGPASVRVLAAPPAPNPFNPRVVFQLQETALAGTVILDIIDARGLLRRRLHQGPLASGVNRVEWDGRDQQGRQVASGVYWYRLRSSLGTETGNLVLLR